MQAFQDLGVLVERRWRDHNYSEECFPKIAASVLADSNASKRIDPWDVIRWVHNAEALPEQQDVDGGFGDPPITIFCGSRFFIDVYYWLDGTTSIHQHSFSGAFQVLLGSSIHSRYSFREDKIKLRQKFKALPRSIFNEKIDEKNEATDYPPSPRGHS